MEDNINNEVIRLVKEIQDDEFDLRLCEKYNNEGKAKSLRDSIKRKMDLLKVLKDLKA